MNYQTGAVVMVLDPVYFDEEVGGFVAKQLDDRTFLVKLDRPFTRRVVNDGKVWLKVCRDYAEQSVREV